jgi:hypothetical protein
VFPNLQAAWKAYRTSKALRLMDYVAGMRAADRGFQPGALTYMSAEFQRGFRERTAVNAERNAPSALGLAALAVLQ